MFNTYYVNFDSTDVFNVLTKKVLPQHGTERFQDMQEIGEKKCQKFGTRKIEGESLIWDTVNKEKLPTFTNNNKTTSVKVNGEILQIREERKLMNRILVASRS